MVDTMPRHKRSYGYLFCGWLRLSRQSLAMNGPVDGTLGRWGQLAISFLRVVDGICNCFLALKSLPRVSYQFLICATIPFCYTCL